MALVLARSWFPKILVPGENRLGREPSSLPPKGASKILAMGKFGVRSIPKMRVNQSK